MGTLDSLSGRAALVTGAAHAIGTAVARALHAEGVNVILHYRNSRDVARDLLRELNTLRPNSAAVVHADLLETDAFPVLVEEVTAFWGRLDILVHGASAFFPTPVGDTSRAQWDELCGTNLRAPFFLTQAALAELCRHQGSVIHVVDIHGDRPLREHPLYSMTRAGVVMLTKALAVELAPRVRVNAVAPGSMLWLDHGVEQAQVRKLAPRTPLRTAGTPEDVARAVLYLVRDAGPMTGQVLHIDGGQSVAN